MVEYNWLLKALMKIGLIKMKNFAYSKNTFSHVHSKTSNGIAEKIITTLGFHQREVNEYEALKNQNEEFITKIKKSGGKEPQNA